MTQRPHIDRAVQFWLQGTDSMFEFCIEAASVVGQNIEGQTKELGRKIRRSEDTVERYAKVGRLWLAMLQAYPLSSELMRDALDYQYWKTIAPLYENGLVSIDGVNHWFDESIKNRWELEKFRSMLPNQTGKSVWKKSAKKWLKETQEFMKKDLLNSPALDIDPKEYKKVVRAMRLMNGRIEKALAVTEMFEKEGEK